jgi:hypothetical protein
VKHSFFRWFWTSAGGGLFIPFGWFLIQILTRGNTQLCTKMAYPAERIIRVMWPSSLWLMATDGIEGAPKAHLFIFFSVAANVVLYAVLGGVIWSVKHLITAHKGRPRAPSNVRRSSRI